MKKMMALALGLASSLAATAALADDAPGASSGGLSAAVLAGDGFKDGLNLGFGARVGYNIDKIYVGGTFVYHLGKSTDLGYGTAKSNVYYYGVEGGYDVPAGPVVIRPYLGIGMATAKVTIPGFSAYGISFPDQTASDSKVAFWPGATVLYPLGGAFVGADLRYFNVSDFAGLSAFLTAGMKF